MKVSFIATVLNEERAIKSFLESIFKQSKKPDEIIIVDGGSTDKTIDEISSFKFHDEKVRIKLIFKDGNRSVGRNEAIKRAMGDIIVCSDAGCTLERNWIKHITEPFKNPKVDVVAGYYRGNPRSIFEKCLIPYVLVMEDRINSEEFLPASRSMAFKKTIWERAGRFPERFSNNEDYVFANKLKYIGARIFFKKDAIVNWQPLNSLHKAFKMFFRFALGDSESGILRQKAVFIFVRYIFLFYLLLLSFIERSFIPLYIAAIGLVVYVIWAVKKNYRYVNNLGAVFFLPLLQFVSDFAVIIGTSLGFIKRISFSKFYALIKNNKGVSLIVGIYVASMLLIINWGIPNSNHPFNYFMDEWHQAQAVRDVFTRGTPNVPGAANGSMFHFLLSGLMLIPFALIGYINPLALRSSVLNLEMQQKIFHVLRLNTLFFGVASVILIAYLAKKYFKINPFLTVLLFVINPIWISLSNYFKYDIALVFWILLSFLFAFRYINKPTLFSFCLTAFISGLALAVKISALPLLPMLFLSCLLFSKKTKVKQLLLGLIIYLITFLIFGIPDLLLGRGNINEYLYDNLIRTPNYSSNYVLGMPYWLYVLTRGVSAVFGNFLTVITALGLLFIIVKVFLRKSKTLKKNHYLFLLFAFLFFVLSLVPLKIEARGNRLLVLLPFITLISGIFLDKVIYMAKNYSKKIIIFLLTFFFLLQGVEAFGWIYLKTNEDLREISSVWIKENIPIGSKIAIENIPIYQSLPNFILKDYYLSDRFGQDKAKYNYVILDNLYGKKIDYIVVTNKETENYMLQSFKKDFVRSINMEKYKEVYTVRQTFPFLGYFRGNLDYFFSGLVQEPLSISIYKKI